MSRAAARDEPVEDPELVRALIESSTGENALVKQFEAEEALEDAEDAYDNENYESASDLAQEAEELAEEVFDILGADADDYVDMSEGDREDAADDAIDDAEEDIDEARNDISDAEKDGADVLAERRATQCFGLCRIPGGDPSRRRNRS